VAAAAVIGGLLAGPMLPAAAQSVAQSVAQSSGVLLMQARIDGRSFGDGRLAIDPARTANVVITVSNDGASAQRVKTVQLSGTALGLTFFGYDTVVAFDVPAGQTVTRSFPLDLAGLERQATGLLPASLRLLDPERAVLAEADATADVRGSVWSVYGMFGLAIVIATLIAVADLLAALTRQRLPVDRWRRAARFLPTGFGAGLSAVVALSLLRLVPPTVAAEIAVILCCTAAALGLAQLTVYPTTEPLAADGPIPPDDLDDTTDLGDAADIGGDDDLTETADLSDLFDISDHDGPGERGDIDQAGDVLRTEVDHPADVDEARPADQDPGGDAGEVTEREVTTERAITSERTAP
jgi:hypothetical protein